tara:strand:- start:443 stop:862 length:420 start_codon:yes stop_codon:yes gene_type:complete
MIKDESNEFGRGLYLATFMLIVNPSTFLCCNSFSFRTSTGRICGKGSAGAIAAKSSIEEIGSRVESGIGLGYNEDLIRDTASVPSGGAGAASGGAEATGDFQNSKTFLIRRENSEYPVVTLEISRKCLNVMRQGVRVAR